eukprot:936111-Rhodomonas_salina.2
MLATGQAPALPVSHHETRTLHRGSMQLQSRTTMHLCSCAPPPSDARSLASASGTLRFTPA